MEIHRQKDIKVGEFLIENSIITKNQLNEALDMQKDNPQRLIGQILVTQGVLSKEQIISAMELFMITTDLNINYIEEWLDQDEIDLIQQKLTTNV